MIHGPGKVMFAKNFTKQEEPMKKAAVILGSDSDLPVVEKAFAVFTEFPSFQKRTGNPDTNRASPTSTPLIEPPRREPQLSVVVSVTAITIVLSFMRELYHKSTAGIQTRHPHQAPP